MSDVVGLEVGPRYGFMVNQMVVRGFVPHQLLARTERHGR
jgi:hypothetical protein